MSMSKKIALIANGITKDDPEALETILRNNGQVVDIFDVRSVRPTATGFEVQEDGISKSIDPTGYAVVMRIIKGGVSGDTEKSWALQKFFEDAGAKPHIGIEAARKITDKILCKGVLTEEGVSTFPSIAIGKEEAKDRQVIEAEINALGEPPYIVRKSLGSGKDSLVITASMDDALSAMERYRNPPGENPVRSGVIIHKLSPKLESNAVQKYGLGNITEPEKRSYQFRIILVDGKVFGTNICYSEPEKFGLNPAQGATFKAISEESVPIEVLTLAKRAADAHELKIAAVDIALDSQSQPHILDMNASPDLSFTNARGAQLKYAVAQSIQNMMIEGKRAEAYLGEDQNHLRGRA